MDPGEHGFEEHRTHLLRTGYRITGSLADAEDAVQEAWLRLHGLSDADRAEIRDLRAWLTTVVGRLCLDRLRSATARRERYVGPWLPEPIVTTAEDGPLAAVVQDESVRMAAMVVLERLTAPQRVALVLHDALDLPFATIAEVLDCTEATARQHASRARKAVADADPPPRTRLEEAGDVLTRFAAAMATADLDALVALLHPDAVLVNDGGGKVSAALRPVVGAEKVARFLLGLRSRYGDDAFQNLPVLVNGEVGVLTPAVPERGVDATVTVFTVVGGLVTDVYGVRNPDKLTRIA